MLWIARQTIWHPDAIPASEGDVARDVKRWVLPTIDMLLIVGSILGLNGGLPAFAVIYDHAVATVASGAVLVFASACFIGITLPRLWLLELIAKCGLSIVLITYAILLLGLAATDVGTRGFVAGVSSSLCVILVWRIVWIGREQRKRRALAAVLDLRGD